MPGARISGSVSQIPQQFWYHPDNEKTAKLEILVTSEVNRADVR